MKKIKFKLFVFQYFKFSSCFMLFPTLKKIGVQKKIRGLKNIEVPLHLLVKWEVVTPNSIEGQYLYPLYPLFPCSDFVSQMWGWFGGGGV